MIPQDNLIVDCSLAKHLDAFAWFSEDLAKPLEAHDVFENIEGDSILKDIF